MNSGVLGIVAIDGTERLIYAAWSVHGAAQSIWVSELRASHPSASGPGARRNIVQVDGNY